MPTQNTSPAGFEYPEWLTQGFQLPPNWQTSNFNNSNGDGMWWRNLLRATGQFFINGFANTSNAQNQGNPYGGNAVQLGSQQITWILGAVVLFLIIKK